MVLVRWLLLVGVSAVVVASCGGSDADERAEVRAPPTSADAATSRKLQDVLDFQRISLRMLLNQTSGVGNDQRRLERDTETRPRAIWSHQKP
jgi:hypothetical protein